MSENRDRDFSQYDSMTTEELEEILRLDAETPEGEESDVELLLYVMEVLANRRRNTENTGKTALEAWESFQQHYLSDEEDCIEYKPEKRKVFWPRRLIAAAAAIALVVCIPLTANALGWEDIWNVFARWAKETFSFVAGEDAQVSEPSPVDQDQYTSLQELLLENNIDPNIVPSWIPDGYVLEVVEKDATPMQEVYLAKYKNQEQTFIICVQSYIESDPEKIEINEDLIEFYEASNVEYYIFSNADQIRAVWTEDSYECYVSGELTIEEMKLMIDSIGKG